MEGAELEVIRLLGFGASFLSGEWQESGGGARRTTQAGPSTGGRTRRLVRLSSALGRSGGEAGDPSLLDEGRRRLVESAVGRVSSVLGLPRPCKGHSEAPRPTSRRMPSSRVILNK